MKKEQKHPSAYSVFAQSHAQPSLGSLAKPPRRGAGERGGAGHATPGWWQHPGKDGDCPTVCQGEFIGNSHPGFTFAVPTWSRLLKCYINRSFAGQVVYREGL